MADNPDFKHVENVFLSFIYPGWECVTPTLKIILCKSIPVQDEPSQVLNQQFELRVSWIFSRATGILKRS